MKITKYAQSCLLVETKDKRILIDPGVLKFQDSLLENDWININAVLITHQHQDHCMDDAVNHIIKDSGAKLYSSKEVANTHPDIKPEIVKEGDIIEVGEVKVEVVHAVHGYFPALKERGIIVNENIGYIIDDGAIRFYHTSDCIAFDNDYKTDVIAVPINNHGVCFDPFSAAQFSKETKANLVIPMHYDNPALPGDLDKTEEEFKKAELNYKILGIGESVEINE
ncbi:hypothetical protein CL629_02770 [bacterium]|nr:hypothetical protein [bacterium]|tara:strand:- start:2465 stop:3136 length:672 start_codon:yes stop_codon:yes gene_type:complete